MDSRFSFFAWIKFYLNMLKPAKSIVKKYIEVGKSDYIVFQDVFSAYYYYTNKHINHSKSILILHIGENLYTQLEEEFPGIFKSKKLRRKFEMIVNFGLNRVNKIVYISRRAMNASHLPDKSDFVYNGVPDFPFIYPKFIGFPINIITVGSINGHKGQVIIVESISLMDKKDRTKIHVYFVGGGLLEKTLKLRCEVLGISDTITFMGVRNDVAELLKNMHLFILPSISEGLPMSIIEALRQGLYIMTTDTGGTQEMIGNGFGEIINRDPQMIKDAICDLIVNNKINLDSMINARKHYEENFRLESMINKYAEIINSL
jgi:glycosyltransferase involved in cell wall biosynthesis